MAFISDTLLIVSALFAAIYCAILSRRLKRLTNIDEDVGQSIYRLSDQLDALTKSTRIAAETGQKSAQQLRQETQKAEATARHLELLIASLHSLPKEKATPTGNSPFQVKALNQAVASK